MAHELEKWLSVDTDNLPPMQQKVLDAAAKAFTTYGFSSASIDLIASQIGATKGSVYYHYRSKIELFFAVHKRAMVMNLKTQVPVFLDEALSPAEKLTRMCYLHARLMMDTIYYQRVTVQGVELYQSVSTSPMERESLAEVISMRDSYESMFLDVIQHGMRTGCFSALDASVAAKGVLGMLNWITVWYRPRQIETSDFRDVVANQLATQAVQGVLQSTESSDD